MRHPVLTVASSDLPPTRLRMCLLAAVVLAGCGSSESVGTVQGKVTYRGQPVSAGSVVFESAAMGEAVMVPLQNDGSFVAKSYERTGLLVGNYRIAVTPNQIGSGEIPLAVNPGETPAPPPASFPAIYHSTTTSGLTVEVKQGSNITLDLTLID